MRALSARTQVAGRSPQPIARPSALNGGPSKKTFRDPLAGLTMVRHEAP